MHHLEQRAYRILRDWKALRHHLEQLHQAKCLESLYTTPLEDIEASLVVLPELVYCIVGERSTLGFAEGPSATTRSHTHTHQPPTRAGLAAVIRRTRYPVADIDEDD